MAQLRNISKKDSISLDNSCYLISQSYIVDDIGQEIATETKKMYWCAELSVTSNEFFKAGQSGIKSEVTLLIDYESYSNETIAEYNSARYVIYRTYPRNDGMVELYLTKKAGA